MRAFLILAILAAILAVALGDTCIGSPTNLPLGASCGNAALGCRKGGFCNYKGVCAELIKVGGNCSNPLDVCVPEAGCRGPAGSKLCLALAGPGETCSTSSNFTSIDPPCAGNYPCTNGKCANAYPGDSCTANTDCGFTNCTSGICAFVADGQSCFFGLQCGPQSYCNTANSLPVCAPLPTSGNCTSQGACAFGYSCALSNPTDTVRQCILWSSLAEGSYCNGFGSLCKSGLCSNSYYCATNPPDRCSSDGQCGGGRVCQCGFDHNFGGGFGYCASASCTQEQKDFTLCVNTNCKSSTTGKGLCATLNCATQYSKLDSCSSASGLFASFTFVSLAVLFISFFSRQL